MLAYIVVGAMNSLVGTVIALVAGAAGIILFVKAVGKKVEEAA